MARTEAIIVSRFAEAVRTGRPISRQAADLLKLQTDILSDLAETL